MEGKKEECENRRSQYQNQIEGREKQKRKEKERRVASGANRSLYERRLFAVYLGERTGIFSAVTQQTVATTRRYVPSSL